MKSALVVDDSKSARFVLKRMLNDLGIEVDTAESAATALDYLSRNQPDVIFMDHMMPGMDGFEAVKRIKENPLTAIIPIMMYTSKCGDVYLSQARALGAMGIIAKTIAPVALRDSLLKLGVIDDVLVEQQPSDKSELIPTEKSAGTDNTLDTYVQDLHRLMDDQTVELHKSMWLGIESVGNELFNRLNSELEDRLDKIIPEPEEPVTPEIPLRADRFSLPFYLASFLLMVSIIFNVSLFVRAEQLKTKVGALTVKQAALHQKIQAKQKQDAPAAKQTAGSEFVQWALNKTISYPADELALNEKRIPDIEVLVQRALETRYRGRIILQTHAGRFCMISDETGIYRLADSNLPVTECEYIGNNLQPGDDPSTHQSVAFANYLVYINGASDEVLIEVVSLSRSIELVKYPELVAEVTAGTWNSTAQLNNQITIKLVPVITSASAQ